MACIKNEIQPVQKRNTVGMKVPKSFKRSTVGKGKGKRKTPAKMRTPGKRPVALNKDGTKRKPHPQTRRPEASAHRECHRDDPVGPCDPNDPDYIPPRNIALIHPTAEQREKRSDAKTYFNCADQLPVLKELHDIDEEAGQYRQFVAGITATCEPKLHKTTLYYETEFAVWLPTIIRYTRRKMKEKTVLLNKEKEFWSKNNGCVSTVTKQMRQILLVEDKPLVVVLGHKQKDKNFGHCLALIINPCHEEGRKAIVKDCNPLDESTVKGMAYTVVKDLGFTEVDLVGLLDTDEHVINTDCIREAYKVVGSTLDGDYVWNRDTSLFKKTINIKSRKEILK